MYELLVKLNDELDYKKFTIKDLEEMKEILQQFQNTDEVKLVHMEDKGDGKSK